MVSNLFKFILVSTLIVYKSQADSYKISYLELDAETYVPVTNEAIEQQSVITYFSDSKNVDNVFKQTKYLNKKNPSEIFNVRGRFERLKDKKVLYMDQTRHIYDSNGELEVPTQVVRTLIEEIEKKMRLLCSLKEVPANVVIKCPRKQSTIK